MTDYRRMYRLGFTPWERYSHTSGGHVDSWIDRATAGRADPPGRALDLGCGRGLHTPRLAARGWETVGIDLVPEAIAAATEHAAKSAHDIHYVAGDVTALAESGLGEFDLFLDIGCFQGLDPRQRTAMAAGVTASARPGATLLMMAFGPSRWAKLVEGVSRAEIEAAFTAWDVVEVAAADTAGLGWPMNRTSPQWYLLRARNS